MTLSYIIDRAIEFKEQQGVAPKIAFVNPMDAQQLAYSLVTDSSRFPSKLTVEECSGMEFHLDTTVAFGHVKFS